MSSSSKRVAGWNLPIAGIGCGRYGQRELGRGGVRSCSHIVGGEDEMASWGKVIQGGVLGASTILLIAGCNSGGGQAAQGATKAPTTSTIAPDVPAGFDVCKDIPQSVLQAESFGNPDPDIHYADGAVKWRGCGWDQKGGDGYSVTIDMTNITLPMARANKQFSVVKEMTIDGRPTVVYIPAGQQGTAEHCLMDVQVKGGSLELSVINDPSAKATAGQDSCEIGERLANEIVPALPSSL